MTDLLILAHLLPGPQHGYALKKQVGLITGRGEIHNNLIYPLLRKFEKSGWITRRTAPGQRGQTREVYAITRKGKDELQERLSQFKDKDAGSENAFRLRVGLFEFLDREASRRILSQRDTWLAARQERLAHLTGALRVGRWGGAVLKFLLGQIRAERRWIAQLQRQL